MQTQTREITVQAWTDGINEYSVALPTADLERFKADMEAHYGEEDFSWTGQANTDLVLDSYRGLDDDGYIIR